MKKLALRFCTACLMLSASLSANENLQGSYTGPKEQLEVYLLIGQSNMAGRAPYGKEEAGPIDRCYLLNAQDQWEPARNPLNRYSTIRKDLKVQKMGPGYAFSKAMIEKNKSISLGLVVNARGGTSIGEWKKGSRYYTEALRRAKEAQKTGTLKGILWHQGESDSQKPDGYLKKLKSLISNLRTDLDMAELPFVVGQVYYDAKHKPHTKQLNKQLAKLPSEVPFTGCVSSDTLTTLDRTHFDHPAMLLLGQRYGEEMLKLQSMVKSGQKTNHTDQLKTPKIGTDEWMRQVDRIVGVTDAAGHGPDLGSEEWMQAVAHKLQMHQASAKDLLKLGSEEWKIAVHRKVFHAEPNE